MRCACVSETHGNIIFYLRKNLCMRVWDPRKRSKKMRENYICRLQRFFRHACMLIQTRTLNACVSFRRMPSVLLRWVPSLNDRSKLKGQYTDVKSGCVTSVGPSLTPHILSLKQKSRATVPLRCYWYYLLPWKMRQVEFSFYISLRNICYFNFLIFQ